MIYLWLFLVYYVLGLVLIGYLVAKSPGNWGTSIFEYVLLSLAWPIVLLLYVKDMLDGVEVDEFMRKVFGGPR